MYMYITFGFKSKDIYRSSFCEELGVCLVGIMMTYIVHTHTRHFNGLAYFQTMAFSPDL